MIKLMGSNDVYDAMTLVRISYEEDAYFAYDNKDEAYWTAGFLELLAKAKGGDPNYLAIKFVDESNNMLGFMLCSTYIEQYCGKPVMDVKEMIVDYSAGKPSNALTVKACFDYMIEHIKAHGGADWRADTIHSTGMAKDYVAFLQKQYNCTPLSGVRGVI